MEKLRPLLQWLFKNRFWLTCGLVALASAATWWIASGDIEKTRVSRVSTLNNKKTSIDAVNNTTIPISDNEKDSIAVHPNATTESAMNDRIEVAAEAALAAWRVRHDAQKTLLQFSPNLPPHIIRELVKHEPMELPVTRPLLDGPQKDTFRDISKDLSLLSGKIKSTWRFDEKGVEITEDKKKNSQRGMQMANTQVSKDLVRWSKSNQKWWTEKATAFKGFNGNQDDANRPTSEQMLALQQDLWILSGMLDAVAKVNEGYVANDLAPIERIDHILIGQDAVSTAAGELSDVSFRPDAAAISPGGKKKKGGISGPKKKRRMGKKRSGSQNKRGAVFNATSSTSPFHGRYVNRDYTQLGIDQIRTAITSKKLTEQSYLAVAKRIPVRIAMKMDERRINDFLAAAANSPFAFEIRQVRINKHVAGAGVSRTATGGGGGGDKKGKKDAPKAGVGGGSGPTDAEGGKGGAGGDDETDGAFVPHLRSNFDVKIEFLGIVKIYNPVDETLFFPERKKDKGAAVDSKAVAKQ